MVRAERSVVPQFLPFSLGCGIVTLRVCSYATNLK